MSGSPDHHCDITPGSCDPRVLSSAEQLSTEEESSDSGGEGGSDDELARNLESLLGGRKTTRQLSHEQEELQRQELRKLLDKPVREGCG